MNKVKRLNKEFTIACGKDRGRELGKVALIGTVKKAKWEEEIVRITQKMVVMWGRKISKRGMKKDIGYVNYNKCKRDRKKGKGWSKGSKIFKEKGSSLSKKENSLSRS